MKTLTHVVLPIAILLAMIVGVTFVRHYTGTIKPKPKPSVAAPTEIPMALTEAPLQFETTVALTDPLDPSYRREYEQDQRNQYAFWFRNVRPTDAELSVSYRSCQCAEIQVGVVDPAVAETVERLTRISGPLGLRPLPMLLPVGAEWFVLAPSTAAGHVTWKTLEPNDGQRVQVAAARNGIANLGLVRLAWNAKEKKVDLHKATIMTHPAGQPDALPIHLEVPYAHVPPMQLLPTALDFDQLSTQEQRTITLTCWSATRPNFRPIISDPDNHPCIEVGPLEPISRREWEELARLLGPDAERSHPLAAYRVAVTVFESRNGQQLDVGTLNRRLRVQTGIDGIELTLPLRVVIRGDIEVAGQLHDEIDLGMFKARGGTVKTVSLSCTRPGMKLRLSGVEPPELAASLKVKLDEEAGVAGLWKGRLRITVPPNTVSGLLPPGSQVVLQIADSPRKVRLRLRGQAAGN